MRSVMIRADRVEKLKITKMTSPDEKEADAVASSLTSRLILKNLPSKITAERLRKICSELGLVTDCQLKYAPSGKFRNFAFVGFRTIEEASAARSYLHNTYIDSARIQVEFCQKLDEKSAAGRRKLAQKVAGAEKHGATVDDKSSVVGRQIFFENLPRNIKKKSLRNFLTPVKPLRVDISSTSSMTSAKSSVDAVDDVTASTATVKVAKKSDANLLLKLNGRFFGGRKICVRLADEDTTANLGGTVAATVHAPPDVDTLKRQTALIAETGRLFVRNVAYVCQPDDVRRAFEVYGPLADVKTPLDPTTKQHKGYAMVSFVLPEHALRAYAEMDGTVFNGRMLHIIAGEESREEKKAQEESRRIAEGSSFKAKKSMKQSAAASSSHNWNSLFLAPNAVAEVLVQKLDTEKSQLLDPKAKTSLGVRMALGETQLVKETRDFLEQNGVYLDSFSAKKGTKRSSTVILVKNLPSKTSDDQLRVLFSPQGELGRLILPPSGISALVEFMNEQEAKKAFKALAYKKFKNAPLFLEWAPDDVFSPSTASTSSCAFVPPELATEKSEPETPKEDAPVEHMLREIEGKNEAKAQHVKNSSTKVEQGAVIFVKNLNFQTSDDELLDHFSRVGPLNYATVAKKKSTHSDDLLSMGYGFVEFKNRSDALNALKSLQQKPLNDFALELKLSDRPTSSTHETRSKCHAQDGDQSELSRESNSASTSKLLVKNVPFQANVRELENLFKTFGQLRSVRLPKKSASSNQHRGFAFIDFSSDSSAKKAFDALKLSTHLYGRRLVLEWAAGDENLDDLRARVAEYSAVDGEDFRHSAKRRKIMLEDVDK